MPVSLNKPFSLKASVSPPLCDEAHICLTGRTKRAGVRELSAPGPQAHGYLLRPQFSASDVQVGLQQVFPILYKNKDKTHLTLTLLGTVTLPIKPDKLISDDVKTRRSLWVRTKRTRAWQEATEQNLPVTQQSSRGQRVAHRPGFRLWGQVCWERGRSCSAPGRWLCSTRTHPQPRRQDHLGAHPPQPPRRERQDSFWHLSFPDGWASEGNMDSLGPPRTRPCKSPARIPHSPISFLIGGLLSWALGTGSCC